MLHSAALQLHSLLRVASFRETDSRVSIITAIKTLCQTARNAVIIFPPPPPRPSSRGNSMSEYAVTRSSFYESRHRVRSHPTCNLILLVPVGSFVHSNILRQFGKFSSRYTDSDVVGAKEICNDLFFFQRDVSTIV